MKKLCSKIFLFCIGLVLSLQLSAANNVNVDPVKMLNKIADDVIASLKTHQAHLKSNPDLVYKLAKTIIVPHADLSEMSQRVLPPKTWNTATSSQKAQFQAQFTTLLVHTYAAALADYTDQVINFYPVRGGYANKNKVTVNSVINRSDGPSISVNYRVILNNGEWKLYDIIVEGVSLLQSFQDQFQQKLSTGDMAKLLVDLQQHNAKPS
jgi:phospholipid transport system substrate-binding protein